jgi:hypothetical protein
MGAMTTIAARILRANPKALRAIANLASFLAASLTAEARLDEAEIRAKPNRSMGHEDANAYQIP